MIDSISLLQQLVEIHSGPENIDGINRVQSLVEKNLRELGFQCRSIENQDYQSGRMLVGDLAGESRKVICLVSHADTLEPGISATSRFLVKGDMATGAGVIDDKGGQVVA